MTVLGSIKIGNAILSDRGDGTLRITNGNGNENGYIDVGAKNREWAHIYTDRLKFSINKSLYNLADPDNQLQFLTNESPVKLNTGSGGWQPGNWIHIHKDSRMAVAGENNKTTYYLKE